MFDLEHFDVLSLRKLNIKELNILSSEIQEFIIKVIKENGGHLSSNLGVIDLSIALHYAFLTPDDKLFFDVGHQMYAHKILTGRGYLFKDIRKYNGLSGFSSKKESEFDFFESGHSGTSLSSMFGYLTNNKDSNVVGIVGDASIINGINFEGLNLLGSSKDRKAIIILNDNFMSISKSVGSLNRGLSKIRALKSYKAFKKASNVILPTFLYNFLRNIKRGMVDIFQKKNIFEDLDYIYLGPIDGHNIKSMINTFNLAKKYNKSVVIHVITQKGRGLNSAENDTEGYYHSYANKTLSTLHMGQIIFDFASKLNNERDKFYCITPAMKYGSGLTLFSEEHKDYFIDCGINEELACLSAYEISKKNKVILSIYSTFSNRIFDILITDVTRQNGSFVICLDRCGLNVDGVTHHGIYDLIYLLKLNNCEVICPYTPNEAKNALIYGLNSDKLVVIRYNYKFYEDSIYENIPLIPHFYALSEGTYGYILSFSRTLDSLLKANLELNNPFTIVNCLFLLPIDKNYLDLIGNSNKIVIIYEESIQSFSYLILDYFNKMGYKNKIICKYIDKIVEFGETENLLKEIRFDSESIKEDLKLIIEEN